MDIQIFLNVQIPHAVHISISQSIFLRFGPPCSVSSLCAPDGELPQDFLSKQNMNVQPSIVFT